MQGYFYLLFVCSGKFVAIRVAAPHPKMFCNYQQKVQNQQKNLFHELLININFSDNTTPLPARALTQAVLQLRFIFYYLILIECTSTDTVHKYQAQWLT